MTSAKHMTSAKQLYERWINELWAGRPVAGELVSDDFDAVPRAVSTIEEVGPFVEGELLAARWIGTGAMADGPKRFTGNDILRFANGRFVEYWTGTSDG